MSFQQGLSGLNSSAKQLDVVGNNIANSSTVGFKMSQTQFADQYAVSLAGSSAGQTGMGSRVAAIAQQFSQGNITNTANAMDHAISGNGFFRLVDSNGAVLYSRNGQLQLDKDGYIVNNQGHKITGYMPDATGTIVPSQPLPIQISSADMTPNQTTNVTVGANLDARDVVPPVAVFDPANPNSYNFSTSLTVFDSLGVNHVATVYMQRQAIAPTTGNIAIGTNTLTLASAAGLSVGNTVTVTGAGTPDLVTKITAISGNVLTLAAPAAATVAGAAVSSNAGSADWQTYLTVDGVPVPAVITPMATLTFNTLGQLIAPAGPPIGSVVSSAFTPVGAAAQTLTMEFGQTTQYGDKFGVNSMTQDGYTSGRLIGINTGADGVVLGRYSNGQSRPLGQILLANFNNPQGLQPMGNNEWAESPNSGSTLIGVPGSASLGLLQSSAVEESNVDLTAELVSMIIAQRVYQANAQSIKTQDQVLQTLVNLR